MKQIAELKGDINHYTFFENIVYHTRVGRPYVDFIKFSRGKPILGSSEAVKTYDNALAYVADKTKRHLADGVVSDFRNLQLYDDSNRCSAYSREGNFLAAKHDTMLVVFDATTLQVIHAADYNREHVGSKMQVTPDGRYLCVLGSELLFIDTKTWQLVHEKKIARPFSFGTMCFSPSGKKLLLTSERGAHQFLDIENKPKLIFKTLVTETISHHPYFIDENTVCGYHFDNRKSSLYDVSTGSFVPLDKHLPLNLGGSVFYNGHLFSVDSKTHSSPKKVLQVDLKDFTLVSETALGEPYTIYLLTPVQCPSGNEFAFAGPLNSSDAYTTTLFKYNMNDKTLTEMKTVEGRATLVGFLNNNTAVTLNGGKPAIVEL